MSIIAMLMYHSDDIEFIKSSSVSLLQHEAFNWHIEGDRLKRVNDNCYSSKLIDSITEEIIRTTSVDERKRLVDILFYIAKDNPKSSLLDIKRNPIKYFTGMIKRRRLLPHDDSVFYKAESKKIRKCTARVFKESLNDLHFKI